MAWAAGWTTTKHTSWMTRRPGAAYSARPSSRSRPNGKSRLRQATWGVTPRCWPGSRPPSWGFAPGRPRGRATWAVSPSPRADFGSSTWTDGQRRAAKATLVSACPGGLTRLSVAVLGREQGANLVDHWAHPGTARHAMIRRACSRRRRRCRARWRTGRRRRGSTRRSWCRCAVRRDRRSWVRSRVVRRATSRVEIEDAVDPAEVNRPGPTAARPPGMPVAPRLP